MKIKLGPRTLLAFFAAVIVGTGAALAAGATAATASSTIQSSGSQNWAGYVASGKTFSSVSGSWTEPTINAGQSSDPSYSAVWVGLGGTSSSSSKLEQIGTGADYANGQTDYYAWYELLPAGQVKLNLAIHPGDKISAKVSVSGNSVTMSLADNTTGQSVTKTLQMSNPDTSSAEWIVEAPAAQTDGGSYQILPLADFSNVTFSSASATAGGHTGAISDPDWSATQVQLDNQGGFASTGGPGYLSDYSSNQQSGGGATTSSLSGDGFSVSYQGGAVDASTSGSSSGAGQYPGSGNPYSYGGGGNPYSGDGGSYPYSYGGGYAYSYGGYGYAAGSGYWLIVS